MLYVPAMNTIPPSNRAAEPGGAWCLGADLGRGGDREVIKRAHERGDSGAPPDGADAWRRDNNVPLSGNEQVSLSSVG